MNHADAIHTHDVHPQESDVAHAGWPVKLFRLVARFIFRLFFRVKVVGMENVPDTPVIICANHLGWTDAFLPLLFFPVEPRIYALGERQVAHISALHHFIIKRLNVMVALDRDKPREALRIMEDILEGGASLLIFPEGRVGKEEGGLRPLQPGASHLSLHTSVPILPVGLTGTSELWLRRTLTMRIGKPIDPAQFTGDLRTRMSTLTWGLDAEMRTLLPGDGVQPRIKLLRRWLTRLF